MSAVTHQALAKKLREILMHEDGPASDAERAVGDDMPWEYGNEEGFVYIAGTIELRQLADEVLDAIAELEARK